MLHSKNQAFTLVELLVVIAIIGLLSTIVLISTKGLRDKGNIAKNIVFDRQIESTLGADLIGRWDFNEGTGIITYDSSGWKHDGTLTNGPEWSEDTPSGKGSSLYFDGVNDYLETNLVNNIFFYNGFTGSLWINPKQIGGTGNDKGIISKTEGTHGENGFVLIQGNNNRPQQINLYLNNSGYINSGDFLKLNNWHHVVFVIEPGNPNAKITFYADGKLSGTKQQNLGNLITSIQTTNSLQIGRRYTSDYFKGLIDDVRIYSVPLTLSQVESLYYTGLNSLLAKGLMTEEEYQDKSNNI